MLLCHLFVTQVLPGVTFNVKSSSSNFKMLVRIEGKAQNYDWGKLGNSSKVAELAASFSGFDVQDSIPYAEVCF